jgi:peptidyl-prolyl cis-trans isomerase C
MAFRNRLMGVGTAAVLAAFMALAGCGDSAPEGEAAAAVDASAVAALVNNQPIYVSDVINEARVKGVIGHDGTLEVDSAEFDEILDGLIDIKLLAIEAVSRGLDEDPEARHRLETARENILGNILIDAIVGERVDEAAIKKMYEAQIAIWELGDEAHVRHILAETKEDIEKIAAELKAGAPFDILASRKSLDDATKMDGGDLGYMTEEDARPEFAKVIRETPTGGVSRPFEDEDGWHIVKIDERRKEQPPSLQDLRGPILKHLTTMQIGEVLKELRTEAKIEKQTSPRNSPLDVDPFTLAPEQPEAAPPPAPAFDASARSPVSESRERTPAAATPAKPPATPPPAAGQPAPAQPQPRPAASPTGPVSESRPGGGQ